MSPLRCDFCTGTLVMDDSREFAVCEFCGTKYLKSTIQQKIQEIKGTVSVDGVVQTKAADFLVRGGKLIKYNGEQLNVVIPNSVITIGMNAFRGLAIQSVIIPNSVEAIEQDAFLNCKHLFKISIPDSVTYIAPGAFDGCNELRKVTYPHFEKNAEGFRGTPAYTRWRGIKWEEEGKCGWCGGYLSKITYKCKNCGRNYFDYDMRNV